MTIAILNIVRAIPMYARVLHSELSVSVVQLASTSFAFVQYQGCYYCSNVFMFTKQVDNLCYCDY